MLSDLQVKLINELCDYVEANVAPENFNMVMYRDGYGSESFTIKELTTESPDVNICGTAGCMIGYAPQCHPELHKDAGNWDDVGDIYCESSALWSFMFGCRWEGVQNTPKGSVERIRLALEYDAKGMTQQQWISLYRALSYDASPTSTEELKNVLEETLNVK